MSTSDAAPAGTEHRERGDGWFVRAAGAVGDLGSPFYREERQRDVWNEASAVGMQLVVWLGLAAAAAMVWIGGAAALPYAFTLYGVLGAAAWVTLLYARALGVSGTEGARLVRARTVVYALLFTAFVVGVAHAGLAGQSGTDRWSTGTSTVVGAVSVVTGLTVGVLISGRVQRARQHQG